MKERGDKDSTDDIGNTILEELALYEGLFQDPIKRDFVAKSFVAGALSAIVLVIKAMAGEYPDSSAPQKLFEIHDQLEAWHKSHP